MDEESSRDTVLAGVRRANAGRQAEGAGPFAWPAPPLSVTALVDLFVARAEGAQASVSVVSGFAEARQRVAGILAKAAVSQTVVSDDAWCSPWDVSQLSRENRSRPENDSRPEDHSRTGFDDGPRNHSGSDFGDVIASAKQSDGSVTMIAKASGVGITSAAYGIADTGTIVVCSGEAGGRAESLLPPVHVALLKATDLVPGLPDLFAALNRDRRFGQSSAVTFITGPSRTADIELTLTIGVHGPRQLFIVLVKDIP
jgi:hypothetical protein